MKNQKTNYVIKTLIFCLIAFPNLLSSQIVKSIVYYDSLDKKCDSLHAFSFGTFEKNLVKKTGIKMYYYDMKNISSQTFYDSSDIDNVKDSVLYFHKNGNISLTYKSINKDKHDTLKTYYENGTLKRADIYELGEFIKGKCYDSNGKKVNYFPYMTKAEYINGNEALYQFIIKNFVYPKILQKKGINGFVTLKFVVETDGSVKDVKVIDGAEHLFNEEAIRVIKLTKWIPGRTDGVYFKSYRILPLALNVADE